MRSVVGISVSSRICGSTLLVTLTPWSATHVLLIVCLLLTIITPSVGVMLKLSSRLRSPFRVKASNRGGPACGVPIRQLDPSRLNTLCSAGQLAGRPASPARGGVWGEAPTSHRQATVWPSVYAGLPAVLCQRSANPALSHSGCIQIGVYPHLTTVAPLLMQG